MSPVFSIVSIVIISIVILSIVITVLIHIVVSLRGCSQYYLAKDNCKNEKTQKKYIDMKFVYLFSGALYDTRG